MTGTLFTIMIRTQMYIFYHLFCSFQVREFDAHNLYGNVSGYIGFFLGYSLFQIPNFFLSIILFLRKFVPSLINIPPNDIPSERITTLKTRKENSQERNIYEELDQFKTEFYEQSRKFQKWSEKLEENESLCLDN